MIPYIVEGIVKANNDPQQMGRCKIWIPLLDGEDFDVENLDWCEYASPFAGTTKSFPAGPGNSPNSGYAPYGMWAIPKVGAIVLVFHLNGDPRRRFYFGGYYKFQMNRGLPAGRNTDGAGGIGPFTESHTPLQPSYDNLKEQFQGNLGAPEAKTRGVFERQAAQHKTEKDGTDGYAVNPVEPSELDPEVYCWTTPGHHALIMTDADSHCRVRIKTSAGHQAIFDDTNERIYISTARGGSYIELDQDGRIHVFGADSISIRSGADINLAADNNVNISAGKSVNIQAQGGDLKAHASGSVHINAGASVFATACSPIHINTSADLFLLGSNLHAKGSSGAMLTGGSGVDINGGSAVTITGGKVNLNGPGAKSAGDAGCAAPADPPSVVPNHEPWNRPASKGQRNPNWKA